MSRFTLDDLAIGSCRGIDRNLVGACKQQPTNIFDAAHPAADRQRHEAGFRRAANDIQHGAAVLMGRGNVEEAQFVGAGGVIRNRRFDGIAGVAQVDEIDALDHAAVLDVETGNDADLEHPKLP